MTIGSPVQLTDTTVPAAGTSSTFTTIADSPAGNAIFVAEAQAASNFAGTPSCSDSAGNTYSLVNVTSLVGPPNESVVLFYALSALHLPLGGTITVTDGVGSTRRLISGISVPGITALDVNPAGNTSAGTAAPSISTGTLAQAEEIVLGFIGVSSGNSDTYTESAGFTSATAQGILTNKLHFAYQIVAATTSVTFAPTLGTSRPVAYNAVSFKGSIGPITGAGADTFADAALSSTGGVLVQGAGANTFGAVSLSATGTVVFPAITGTANIQLGSLSEASTGGVLIQAAGSITLANLGAIMSASVVVGATANLTFDAMTEAGTGAGSYFSNLSATFAPMSLSAAGTVTVNATGAISLSSVGLVANAPVTVSGSLAKTFGGLSPLASGANLSPLTGTFSQTLSQLTLSATGFLWSVDPDTPESWATVSPTSTNWTNTSDSGEVWVPIPDVPESWS